MGLLIHGRKGARIAVDDRALAHLQVVMTTKLRKGEGFAFSWTEPGDEGVERGTIWLHPSSTLRFRFAGNRIPALNDVWLAQLAELANSNTGLHYIPEPTASHPPSASVQDDESAPSSVTT
jgi:hypothetical protein